MYIPCPKASIPPEYARPYHTSKYHDHGMVTCDCATVHQHYCLSLVGLSMIGNLFLSGQHVLVTQIFRENQLRKWTYFAVLFVSYFFETVVCSHTSTTQLSYSKRVHARTKTD